MKDIWVKAQSAAALAAFCAEHENVLGPARGRPAIPANPLAEPPVEAAAACGDPSFSYACVRAAAPVQLPDGMTETAPEEGEVVLGVWA